MGGETKILKGRGGKLGQGVGALKKGGSADPLQLCKLLLDFYTSQPIMLLDVMLKNIGCCVN